MRKNQIGEGERGSIRRTKGDRPGNAKQPNQKRNPPMITSAKNYAKKKTKTDRQNPWTNGKSKAVQTESHKVHRLNSGMIRCLLR